MGEKPNFLRSRKAIKFLHVEKVGEAANIVVMDVPSSGSVCELRKQGFYDYLNEIGYRPAAGTIMN